MPFGVVAFVSTFVVSVLIAPLVAKIALRMGIVDTPDGHRKLHERPIPLTGGPTILIALATGIVVTLWWFPDLLKGTPNDINFLISLFCSGAVIVALGMIDDRYKIRGRQKLAGQIIAAMIMLPSGIMIREVNALGIHVSFGDLAPIITIVFIVGAINALNLIDGVDGLACTAGLVLCLSIAAVSASVGSRPDGEMISLVLAGALSGFLIFNFPPARMFLGDSGAMLIGLVLGTVALKCSIKQFAVQSLLLPTAIWAIPIFDVSMAIVRRKLTGRSIYESDRGHIHHCLERKGLGGAKLLLSTAALCAITGLGAVVAALWNRESLALIGIAAALLLLIFTRSFGHTEMVLLSKRASGLAKSMLTMAEPNTAYTTNHSLHGDQNWSQLWETLIEFAERFEMDSVDLMVNLPLIGEEYHANWRRKNQTETHQEWKSEIPLIVENIPVGHIRVVGAVGEGSICKWMSDLIGGLEAFEDELVHLIEDLRRRKLAPSDSAHVPEPEHDSASDLESESIPQSTSVPGEMEPISVGSKSKALLDAQ